MTDLFGWSVSSIALGVRSGRTEGGFVPVQTDLRPRVREFSCELLPPRSIWFVSAALKHSLHPPLQLILSVTPRSDVTIAGPSLRTLRGAGIAAELENPITQGALIVNLRHAP